MSISTFSPSSSAPYWRQKLARVSKPVTAPPAAGRVPRDRPDSARLHVDFADDLVHRLQTVSGGSPFLAFVALLSALKICMFRYCNSPCVAIATSPWAAGRAPATPNVWLPAVDWLDRSQTVRDTLSGVRDTLTQCYAHSEIALEELLAQANCTRLDELCRVACVPSDRQPRSYEGFDLVVAFVVDGARLGADVTYAADRYDARSIERMLGHVTTIARSGLGNPDAAIGALPMLDAAERAQLARASRSGPVSAGAPTTVHRLFEERVRVAPDAIAVIEGSHHLSYAQLDERANGIAGALVECGVGPDVVVALVVPRSLSFVAGMLGIMKAGGAYLAIDPGLPLARLAFLLEDSRAMVVLLESATIDRLPSLTVQVLCLDRTMDRSDDISAEAAVAPHHLAYVMYTSGSTGRPKGVCVEHRQLSRYIEAVSARLELQPTWHYALASTVTADLGHTTLFGSLCGGGTLHLISEAHQLDAKAFVAYCRRAQIDCLKIVPSHLRVLLPEVRRCGGLVAHLLVLGGEATTAALLHELKAASAAARIANHYGPTECTVGSTTYAVTSDAMLADALPIGRPLRGVEAYVLDAAGELVPVGVPGELHIGGVGVARGYLHRAALTAARLVPDPFSGRAGARLYRTGDRACWQDDGALRYLGRLDHQIKVRGYRVELGEIESALLRHPDVRQAIVVADDVEGDLRLVAYVVGSMSASVLRAHLRTQLPDYMLPSAFVPVPALPLTPNGKVDRAALRDLGTGEGTEPVEWVPPRTAVEEIVAGIWSTVLQRPRVGATENFFELGGHSLLGTQVVARLQSVLQVDVPLRALFDAPTVAGLAAAIDAARDAAAVPAAPPLRPVRRDRALPLSYAQQRLWFLDQLDPGRATYNVPVAVRLRGGIDPVALRHSIAAIVARHEVLRTTFPRQDGEAVQHVTGEPRLDWGVCDLTHAAIADREKAARAISEREAGRPFDLTRGPLLRVRLLRLGADDHVWLLTMHHIVSDAWSMGVFVRELTALYAAARAHTSAALPPLPVQYADYAVWQRGWLTGAVLEAQVAYWRQQLDGLSPLELPSDHPRPMERSPAGAVVSVGIERGTAATLRQVSQQEGVTLFMLLLAAFQLLLARYAGQPDVAVGTVIANRGRVETEGLIGFFVNTLVLRTVMRGVVTVRDLLARVREVTLGAYAHQDVPFEQLVELLQPERDLGRSPLFQSLLEFNNAPPLAGEVSGAALTPFVVPGQVLTKFDLTLNLADGPAGILGRLTYATDLFTPPTAERLVRHFICLLEQVAANPACEIDGLIWLTGHEQAEILAWNATTRHYPRDSTLVDLFEANVRRAPDAVALIEGERHLTYAELDRRANRLAHVLRAGGVGIEDRVGVCLERSTRAVEVLLAVLKVGAAYVPLDGADPMARLAFLVVETGTRVIVTDGNGAAALAALPARLLVLAREAARIAAQPTIPPGTVAMATNLAYVLFTSGSTGRPKGIAVAHRAIVRLVCGADYATCDATRRVLLHSPLTFDASTFELWAPLLHGGCCVIASDVDRDPKLLAAVVRDEEITTLWLTAAVFNLVMDAVPEALAPVEELLVGGEALSIGHVRRALATLPATQVINGYGPTEATTFSCCARLPRTLPAAASVPIGPPIANTRAYVVDATGQLAAVGVAGELYIGGDGVARGYMQRPGLTAARFVPDEWSGDEGARVYRTGDRVRWRADGALEFLGRQDDQVKIRGFRIEPREIEIVLAAHPGVAAVAVVVHGDGADKRIVAHWVARDACDAPSVNTLRGYLAERLPPYMVPLVTRPLAALPLTPNGKVDRRRLLNLEDLSETLEEAAPRTAVEEIVAGIFAAVLGRTHVGLAEDFFALGGHSLLAIQVIAHVQDALHVDVPLRALFDTPTVIGFAAAVEEARGAATLAAPPPLLPVSRDQELPLSYAQQRLWFLDQLHPGRATYNVPFAVALHGAVNTPAIRQSAAAIVSRHEVLRTTFPAQDGRPVQRVATHGALAWGVCDLTGVPVAQRDATARALAACEAGRPFDLSRGPLLRLRLLRMAPEHHVLLLTMHHIVSDAWSFEVLVREFTTCYASACDGRPPTLPVLPVQYADYALWQRTWLTGDVLEAQLAYWRRQLAGLTALELPADCARPAERSPAAASVGITFATATTAGLRIVCQQEGVTLFMLLLAAFQLQLGRYAGQTDVAVGTVTANRTRVETEHLIGFFVNTLVLRTELRGARSVRDLLARVREVTLGAYAHQEVPFEHLVDVLQPERDLWQSPLFQALLALNNVPARESRMSDAVVAKFSTGAPALTKFDLTLNFDEGPAGLVGQLKYATDVLSASTAARIAAHFQHVLTQIAADPARSLDAVSLLSTEERAQLVTEWNDTAVEYGPAACVHALVAAQARRTPDSTAVLSEDAHLSYSALEARAFRLAQHLRARGVGPDVRVGLCLERSLELVVGLLGVWYAGGAYLPLDPEHPPERLTFLLRDADVPVVVTTTALAAAWMEPARRSVVRVDGDAAAIGAWPATAPASGVGPEHTAYVLYTSGSTGAPKGVEIAHRALHNHMAWINSTFAISAADRVLQKTPIGFDASVWEFWAPLLAGGAVVMAAPGGHRDPAYVCRAIQAHAVTVVQVVPSLLRLLVDEAEWLACASLRLVFVGGEALTAELSRRSLARPNTRLVNLYGPTEATIDAVTWECVRAPEDSRVPIGRPIANTQAYVLDGADDLVPLAVPGELFLGGAGVARGYLRRPALTAERFVPDPFSGRGGARLYRTGDCARWRSDGVLEYLCRFDHQVKVRGHRIELGEIEAALATHPELQQAVVMPADVGGTNRLVAYVVSRSPVAVSELRRHLEARLPEYMVPSAWTFLAALPLTASGKVDRQALPAPTSAPEPVAYAAPRTAEEETLAGIWEAVLRRRRVGITENFFELGGDSILSIQIVARARQAGLQIEPRHVFQHQTIAALASVAVPASGVRGEQGIVEGPVALTPIQRWFFATPMEERHHYNQTIWLRTPPTVDERALQRVVRRLVAHHDALRMRYRRDEGGWTQWNVGLDGSLDVSATVDVTALRGETQARALAAACEQVQRSLDLTAGPLLRVVHLRLGSVSGGRLLAVAHHLVVDGISWRILLEDLQTGYAAATRGEPIAWAAKTSSYRQWAAALAAYAAAGPSAAEAAYWIHGTVPEVVALPRDRHGANTQASTERVMVALSAAETERLMHEIAPLARSRVEELLLAAVWQSLTAWSGAPSMLLELEGHGREEVSPDVDVTRTVGWFTTQYPLSLEGATNATPWARLRTVKERLRGMPHRGLGYGVWRYLHPDPEISARLAAWPLAEVSVNYLGQLDQVLEADGWLAAAADGGGSSQSSRGSRPYVFVIVASVRGGRLEIHWQYSEELHAAATVEQLALGCVTALRTMLDTSAQAASALSPVDFPYAHLPAGDLERLWSEVGVEGQVTTEVEDVYALSPMQAGMLFHTLEETAARPYVQQLVYEIDALDRPAFERAWELVMQRHSALRTAFACRQTSQMVQVVLRHPRVPVTWHDWRGRAAEAQAQALTDYLQADRARGVDLHVAPLMRLLVARIADDRHWCAWTHHHAIADGWSFVLALKEVAAHYETALRGQTLVLPPARPYVDYVAWLQQQDVRQAEAFWRARLDGIEMATPLPGVRNTPAPALPDQMPLEEELHLSAQATGAVRAWAARKQLTLNTVMQGLWALLLSKYSGVADVLFGATVAGRPAQLSGVERMVGLFINTTPVRVHVDAHASVEDWMRALLRRQLDAQPYEFASLIDIQQWSAVPSGQPLFESLMVFENYPVDVFEQQYGEARETAARSLRGRRLHTRVAVNYPLMVSVGVHEQMLLRVRHHPQRLEPEAPSRMLRQMALLFEAVAEHPDRPVGTLSVLSAAERAQVVTEWNASSADDAPETCLHALVSAQAARTPDTIAVVADGSHVSYAELEARALQLARHLRAHGVGPEVPVGICVGRSLEFVVAVLGIWHAGGAYMPLDPEHPPERLTFQLTDAGVSVVVTSATLAAAWMEPERRAVVCVDRDAATIATWPATAPASNVESAHPAYVIYTSGSTGRPKGVCVEHRQLSRYVEAVSARLALQTRWHYALASTLAADLGHTVVFGSLCIGGTLHLLPERYQLDAEALVAYCRRAQIDCLKIVPSHLRVLLPEIRRHGGLVGHLLVLGGEATPLTLLREIEAASVASRIANHYGPTECTVGSTTHAVAAEAAAAGSLPIGRPLRGVQVYVLDATGGPVPVGVPGELCIGGAGVARGYVRQPALTAARFVPDPFGERAGGRLYRTGDRARWRADGVVEYLGRLDHQVKVRGYRIELEEIEAALATHAAVRQAVVMTADGAGGARLVASVAVRQPVEAGLLRAHLLKRLPAYMVPSVWVILDALPLTANGKVDRRSLSRLEQPVPARTSPRDTTEAFLHDLWADVLGDVDPGIHDNFFDVGGHSLTAISLAARLSRAYGTAIPVGAIFARPTIAELAAYLRQDVSLTYPSSVVPLKTTGTRAPIFCVHPLGGFVHCYVRLSRHLGADQPVYGIQAVGLAEGEEPLPNFVAAAARHVGAIRAVQASGPYYLAGWSLGGVLAYEIARQLTELGDRVALLMLLDAALPLAPERSDPESMPSDLEDARHRLIDDLAAREPDLVSEEFLSRDFSGRVSGFLESAQRAGWMPADITVQQCARWVDVLASNVVGLARYPIAPYSGRVALLRSSRLGTSSEHYRLATWVRGPWEVHEIDAPHDDFVGEAYAPAVAEAMRRCLARSAATDVSDAPDLHVHV